MWLPSGGMFGSAARVAVNHGRRRRAPQESLRAWVLVDIRPVNAVAAARDPPVLPLGGRGVEQAWIPSQRDRNGPAVPQADTLDAHWTPTTLICSM